MKTTFTPAALMTMLSPIVFGLALAGCQKSEKAADASPAPSTDKAASESVAKPASQLPPPDTAVKPSTAPTDATAGGSGNANGPTQANPKALSKQEESTGMPLPGQVNNHSTVPTIGGAQPQK